MAEIKQLKPEEYSEARKEAEKEKKEIEEKKVEKMAEEVKENKKLDGVKAMQIPCSVCGEKKWAGKPRVIKLLEKHGSAEKLLKEYKCRKCRKK